MIIKNPEKHLTDQEFYTYIKFFEFVIEQKGFEDEDEDEHSFSLSNIGIGAYEWWDVFNRVFMSTQILEIPIVIEKGYNFNKEIEEAKKEAEKKTKKEKDKILKIIGKIQDEKNLTIDEVATVSWVWYEVYGHMKFIVSELKVSKDIEKIFRTEINKYLDNFINDKLAIAKKNYYTFETQKKVLIKLIEDDKKIALYGKNFIIKEDTNSKGISQKIPDFCIIQTVYALQKLGYLKVVDVWEEGGSRVYDSMDKRNIQVNIILEDIFITEINNKYKKDNPKNIFEKFDPKRGVLEFAGQSIPLSKKGSQTDAVLLMNTLLKANGDEWKHNDEILEDWGYNDEDQKDTPKNKVYFAGQKINNAVALKTQIEDFIECNTSKARINPKYKKIDE